MVPLHANSPSTFTLPLFTGLTVFVAIEPLSLNDNSLNDASPVAAISPSTFTLPLLTGLTVFVAIEPPSDVLNESNNALS